MKNGVAVRITSSLAAAVFATLLMTSTPLWADESAEGDRAAELENRIVEARERLALTDEQAEAIVPILEAGMEKQSEIFSKHGIDLGAAKEEGKRKRLGVRALRSLRADMDEVREDTLKELEEVLTDEQLAEFRKMQEENRSQMRERLSG